MDKAEIWGRTESGCMRCRAAGVQRSVNSALNNVRGS